MNFPSHALPPNELQRAPLPPASPPGYPIPCAAFHQSAPAPTEHRNLIANRHAD